MLFQYAYVVPLAVVVLFYLTFVITYAIAVYYGDVPPVYAYVSDTGTRSPESCIFSQTLNIGSFLMMFCMYIRYNQLKEAFKKIDFERRLPTLNRIALLCGVGAALFTCVIGNFQETNALIVHLVAAGFAFTLSGWYQCILTYLSFKVQPVLRASCTNYARLCCCILSIISLFLTGGFGVLSFLDFKGEDFTHWKPDDGGYSYHIVSVFAEWILVLCSILFIGLYTADFKYILISEPLIDIKA